MMSHKVLEQTYRDYSLAPTDDLIRFSRSKVNVTTRLVGTGIEVHLLVSHFFVINTLNFNNKFNSLDEKASCQFHLIQTILPIDVEL